MAMTSLLSETIPKFTVETLRSAAKQSEGCRIVPVRLRRAIKRYIKEQDEPHMQRKVIRLSESFKLIKEVNQLLPSSTSKELIEAHFNTLDRSKRWKIKSSYGDIGLKYCDDQTIAYVASRMPAVYSACFRILREVKRRLPDFSPTRVLDFGAGTGSAFWALRDVWPQSVERINLIEPSQHMQRAGQSLIKGIKDLPHIQSFSSIQALSQTIKADRDHDLVIASYVLGEIPSLKDRITLVRQLWDLTGDVLVLVEPGTPEGSNIISQVRSYILWMENRRSRKVAHKLRKESKSLIPLKDGAFVVAPCPHDGPCPLANTGKYCHFVQRLQRTSTQRCYKRSPKGKPLRGFEDEKFSYVAFKRGRRPSEPWPLDGMKIETLKEQHARRNLEDSDIDDELDEVDGLEDAIEVDSLEDAIELDSLEDAIVPYKSSSYDSDIATETDHDEGEEEEVETSRAGVGTGWGRIVYSPLKRGRRVEMDVCISNNREGTEGSFERIVVTKSKHPELHLQARKSRWGDLWPLQSNNNNQPTS